MDNVAVGEHVSYAAILDQAGAVLAHSRHELEGQVLDDPLSRSAATAEELAAQPGGPDSLEVAAPLRVGDRKWGPDDELKELRIAALLHDIGRIGVYDDILDKRGQLTEAEYDKVRRHPVKGAEMLAPIKQLHGITAWIRGHHERFDGTGYPDGLKGRDIPLLARVLAVADAFDSMA